MHFITSTTSRKALRSNASVRALPLVDVVLNVISSSVLLGLVISLVNVGVVGIISPVILLVIGILLISLIIIVIS